MFASIQYILSDGQYATLNEALYGSNDVGFGFHGGHPHGIVDVFHLDNSTLFLYRNIKDPPLLLEIASKNKVNVRKTASRLEKQTGIKLVERDESSKTQ